MLIYIFVFNFVLGLSEIVNGIVRLSFEDILFGMILMAFCGNAYSYEQIKQIQRIINEQKPEEEKIFSIFCRPYKLPLEDEKKSKDLKGEKKSKDDKQKKD